MESIGPLTGVTDAGMRDLGKITTLGNVDLRNNTGRITDSGIANIGNLSRLTRLDISGTG